MATIASLLVNVAADTSQLTKGVKDIQSSLDTTAGIAKKAGAAIAASFSIGAVASAVNKFVEVTGALTDMAAKTGISTTELQKLKFAAEQNGGTLEGVTKGITKMGKALVEGKSSTVESLKALGLSLTDVRNMDPATAFATIGDAIAKLPNPLERSKVAMDLFGKSGADLLPMMTGNLSETMRAAEKLGIVLDEQTVKAGDDLGDTLSALSSVGQAMIGRMLAPLLPALQMVANGMLGAGGVVNYLGLMFDALHRAGLLAIKMLIDAVIKVGELAAKVPGLSKVLGEDALASLKDVSNTLGIAIKQVESGTVAATATTKAAIGPIRSLTDGQDAAAEAGKEHAKVLADIRRAQIPLTDAQKAGAVANDKIGISAETTAKAFKVSAVAVSSYLDSLKNAKEIAEIWKKANEAMHEVSKKFINAQIKDWTDAQRVLMQASGQALATQYLASKEYQEKNYQLTLKGTALNVRQIELERDAKIRAVGDASGEIRKYYKHQIDLATGTTGTIVERMRAAGIATRSDLLKTAEDTRRNYEQMIAQSGVFSEKAIRDQKRIADAARHAAAGTKSAWDKTYNALGDVNTILSNVPGLFAEIGAVAARTGQAIMKNLAEGDVWGAVIAAAVGAIQVITKLWTKFFGTAGRDLVKQFADSLGGFDAMHAKLLTLGAAGEALWVKLTQGVGRNNPEQAKLVIDEINKALAGQDAWMSRLPGLIEKYGLSWEQAGQQAKQAHLDTIAKGLIQDFADLSKAGFDITLITEKMSAGITDYVHQAMRTGTEIPAAMRPLLLKMIEMGTLTDLNGDKITDLEGSGLTFAKTLTEGFKSIVDAIHELTRALGAVPRSVDIDVNYRERGTRPGGEGGVDGLATGGIVGLGRVIPFRSGGFVPMGTDTVPAMLTPGELVLNAAQQRNVGRAIGGTDSAAADREFLLVQIPKAITAAIQRGAA